MDLDKRKVILIMMRSTVNVMMGVILALATMKTRMVMLLMMMAMTRKSAQVLINHPSLWTALVGYDQENYCRTEESLSFAFRICRSRFGEHPAPCLGFRARGLAWRQRQRNSTPDQ